MYRQTTLTLLSGDDEIRSRFKITIHKSRRDENAISKINLYIRNGSRWQPLIDEIERPGEPREGMFFRAIKKAISSGLTKEFDPKTYKHFSAIHDKAIAISM